MLKDILGTIPEHQIARTKTATAEMGEYTIDIYYVGPFKEQVRTLMPRLYAEGKSLMVIMKVFS